jgi:sec-independent protein translocase protein TatC
MGREGDVTLGEIHLSDTGDEKGAGERVKIRFMKKINQHFMEIKIRLYYLLLTFILTFSSSYFLALEIVGVLARPLQEADGGEGFHFIFTEITQAFLTYIQVSLLVSFYALWFLFFYQLGCFLKPGFYFYELETYKWCVVLTYLLTLVGGCVGYLILLPAACQFFLSFGFSPSPE